MDREHANSNCYGHDILLFLESDHLMSHRTTPDMEVMSFAEDQESLRPTLA
jgi:hypothetical protein